jgi:glutaredoxin
MARVKLHRCSWTFLHTDHDACWRVQRALDEQGIEYDLVKHGYGKGRRPEVVALSGQKLLPVIELEDGTVYREESKDMAARVRSGELAAAAPDETPAG